MILTVSEGFEGANTQPSSDFFSQEGTANYINSLHPKLTYLSGLLRSTRTTSVSNNRAYTLSRLDASNFTGTCIRATSSTLKYAEQDIEISYAINDDDPQPQPNELANFRVYLSDGSIRSFGQTTAANVGWKAWSGFNWNGGVTELTLSGNNTINTSGGGWQKHHLRVYKSGSDLKVAMASSRAVSEVPTYTENIGSETVVHVEFGNARYSGGPDEAYIDDIVVYEIEPADIAGLDASFGTYDFQDHIRHFALFYTGVNNDKSVNGTADDWGFTNVGNFEDATDGDLNSSTIEGTGELGFVQLQDFETIALDSGVVANELKSVGFSAFKIADKDGQSFTMKLKNGGSEVDTAQNTQAGEYGTVHAMAAKGTTEFDTTLGNPTKSTNGMIYTLRKT